MLEITEIRKGSIADELEIPVGSLLLEINGMEIRDTLDYTYHSADDYLEILIEPPDKDRMVYEIEREEDDDIGFEFAQDKVRCCGNKCIFCFIDQLPQGLRKSLYIKDEDYRLSFLDGNFITLTAVTEKDINRIIEYHLSPLYVSVHTTNENLRKTMLGRSNLKPVIPILEKLSDEGIELHSQIVHCPGFNDGNELKRTVDDLSQLRPSLKSVGIVPVGLSEHRNGLHGLKPVNKIIALEMVEKYGSKIQKLYRRSGEGFVYLADEYFLLAGEDIPGDDYYDDYPQYENGIGMVRSFLLDFKHDLGSLNEFGSRKRHFTIVTGELMAPVFNDNILPAVNQICRNLKFEVAPVENKLLGNSVTASGLLGGNDIIKFLASRYCSTDMILLPPNCVNSDGLFLDDFTPEIIQQKLGNPVVVGTYNFVDSIRSALNKVN
ncbi:MAG: DUF512 domain-containing protein [candidate division Zixibacteria bacterium]|nr:DUF512 domain-containing protein [candidate division Zixibacteria bacterium]